MLAAATFFILHSIIDVQVRILIVSNEINTKEKKNHAPMAQTSQNDSFGLSMLATATFFYPALDDRCLSSYINS